MTIIMESRSVMDQGNRFIQNYSPSFRKLWQSWSLAELLLSNVCQSIMHETNLHTNTQARTHARKHARTHSPPYTHTHTAWHSQRLAVGFSPKSPSPSTPASPAPWSPPPPSAQQHPSPCLLQPPIQTWPRRLCSAQAQNLLASAHYLLSACRPSIPERLCLSSDRTSG